MDLKILVYRPDDADQYANCVREHGYLNVVQASSPEQAEQHLSGTNVILAWKFPTFLLSHPNAFSVRWIQSMGAGVDDLISDPSVPRHIMITRIVDQFGGAISEYVFSYLLYLAKDIARMNQAQKEHRWDSFISPLLTGKTIGVAGLGSIGRDIVRKARAFDMNVYGLSRSGKQSDMVDRHFDPLNWKDFVRDLDYLVLTLPLNRKTRHAVNRQILLAMKSTACLVNVGRGGLIAEQDLIHVLQGGHLRAAVLDVFEEEPLPADNPLWDLPNVFVTAHLSGPSTVRGVSQFFVENLKQFRFGNPLYGVVDRKAGY